MSFDCVMGRHAKYRAEYAEQAKVICEQLGATDEQIAQVYGVSRQTICRWKQEHPEFRGAIEEGKAAFDDERVVRSLLECVCGYWYQEEKWDPNHLVKTGKIVKRMVDGKEVDVEEVEKGAIITLWRYARKDPRAIMIWMANRRGWQFPVPTAGQGMRPGGERVEPGNALPPGVGPQDPDGLIEEARRYLEFKHATAIDVEVENESA